MIEYRQFAAPELPGHAQHPIRTQPKIERCEVIDGWIDEQQIHLLNSSTGQRGLSVPLHMIACSDDPQRTAIDRSESSQGVSRPRWIAPVRGGRNLIRNSKRRVLRASWTERRRKIHLDELHNRFLSGNRWTDPAHGLSRVSRASQGAAIARCLLSRGYIGFRLHRSGSDDPIWDVFRAEAGNRETSCAGSPRPFRTRREER